MSIIGIAFGFLGVAVILAAGLCLPFAVEYGEANGLVKRR